METVEANSKYFKMDTCFYYLYAKVVYSDLYNLVQESAHSGKPRPVSLQSYPNYILKGHTWMGADRPELSLPMLQSCGHKPSPIWNAHSHTSKTLCLHQGMLLSTSWKLVKLTYLIIQLQAFKRIIKLALSISTLD